MTTRRSFRITPPPARAGTVDFVSGRTRLYGIVGYPIAQARSPQTVTWELRRRAIDAVLMPIEIAPDDFDAVFPALLRLGNLDGLVITVPHKPRVLPHLAAVGPTANVCGGASVLARRASGEWIGDMFDGRGCIAAIEGRGVPIGGLSVQLLGAGGAGAAIGVELARRGVGALRIVDPDAARADALHARLGAAFPQIRTTTGASRLDDIDLLINASPIGMLDPSASPIGDAAIPAHVIVFDAVMDPDRTRLIQQAEDAGCTAIRGREMLDAQISAACDFMLDARTNGGTEPIRW